VTLARAEPDAAALLGAAGQVLATRAALAAHAAGLADALASDIRPGSVAVLSLPNTDDLVAAFLALRTFGVAVAMVDATAPGEELLRCAETVGAARIVAGPERFASERILAAHGALAVCGHAPSRRVEMPPGTLLLKLTSGSTGVPRAIAVSARQLAADTVQIMRSMRFTGRDVTLAAVPLSHSYGIGSCLVPLLLAGTPLALAGAQLPAALAATLAAARVAHFPAVPAMIRALSALDSLPALPELRVVVSAGAPLAPADAAGFHAATGRKVHVFYGSSECGGITYDRGATPVHEAGSVGTPIHRVRVILLGDDGLPVGPGETGRVVVESPAVALGSIPAPSDLTALEAGRFLTGDTGRFAGDGRLFLTGRLVSTLNVAGKKVHPEEVRLILESAPGVRDAAVIGLPDAHRGELVAAVVTAEPGFVVDVPALLAWCRSRLAPHKVPRRLVVTQELPVTSRGKLDRSALERLLGRRG